eukprot:14261010-Alexandrium_andersonii.AAC.1
MGEDPTTPEARTSEASRWSTSSSRAGHRWEAPPWWDPSWTAPSGSWQAYSASEGWGGYGRHLSRASVAITEAGDGA